LAVLNFFICSSRRRHTRSKRDWSSDVCSSDLSELGDVTKSMLVLLLNDYMEKERDGYMGDYAYERSDDRHDYRNGYYDRPYFLSIGKIDLKVPRTRS